MAPTTRARIATSSWLLVIAISIPIALSGTLPWFARLVAGAPAHVCRCEVRGGHATCFCPLCHTDGDEATAVSRAAVRGACGDDDLIFGGIRGVVAVPPAGHDVLAGAREHGPWLLYDVSRPPDVSLRPPTRPPRARAA